MHHFHTRLSSVGLIRCRCSHYPTIFGPNYFHAKKKSSKYFNFICLSDGNGNQHMCVAYAKARASTRLLDSVNKFSNSVFLLSGIPTTHNTLTEYCCFLFLSLSLSRSLCIHCVHIKSFSVGWLRLPLHGCFLAAPQHRKSEFGGNIYSKSVLQSYEQH